MKFKELLNKHKDKSIFDNKYMKLCNTDGDKHRFHIALDGGARGYVSLSDLLFSTPFLSLLEREKTDSDFVTYDYDVYGILSPFTRRLSTNEHHKINLVLLNTDAERIEYIEKFTL